MKDYTNSLELSNAARSLFFTCIAEQKVGGAIGHVGRSHHEPLQDLQGLRMYA